MPSWSGSGATAGAGVGAAFGPVGAFVGGALGGLLGGDNVDGDSRRSSTQTGSLTGQTDESSDVLSTLLEELNKGTAQSDQVLARLLQSIPEITSRYSKDRAIEDSRESVTAALNEVLNAGLPGIQAEASVAGGYNSTATQFMKDNLITQAAAAGARVRQETISDYAGIQKSGADAIMQALGLVQDANTRASSTGKETGTRSSLQRQDSTLTEESATDVGVDY